MGKAIAFFYGIVCYLLFFVTFLYAIGFVNGYVVPKSINTGAAGPVLTAVIINVILLSVFAVQHSVMARPGFKAWWTKFVPSSIERSTYVLFSNLALILIYWQWQPMLGVVWDLSGSAGGTALLAIHFIGWGIVFVSTFMIGHFDLFGLTQVLRNFQGKGPEKPKFVMPGFYKLVRHPIMVGFIIAFWAVPTMTTGGLLFAAMTTAYIVVALMLEERDLITVLGDEYRNYKKKVPMLIPFIKRG